MIGKPVKRLDTPDKVNGVAVFGLDARIPDMQYAVLDALAGVRRQSGQLRCDQDEDGRRGEPSVVQISNGVAVLADNTWSAMEGRRALAIQWDEGPLATLSSADIRKAFVDKCETPGVVAKKVGDAPAMLSGAAKKIEAVYEVPFLAHAPMEPLNCVAQVRADGCDVWTSTQMQTPARELAAQLSGHKPEEVQLHTEYLGGGFGRRGGVDYVGEAVEIAKASGVAVKLTWSREDDIQHDSVSTRRRIRNLPPASMPMDGRWRSPAASRVLPSAECATALRARRSKESREIHTRFRTCWWIITPWT